MRINGLPRALHELDEQFARLVPDIPEGAEKQALSVLHGIVMELWRYLERDRTPIGGPATQDIADLWKAPPAMECEALNQPLRVGTEAPDFELPDASGRLVRLSKLRGRPVVLVFYPLDWSPGSSEQLGCYQQEIDEFKARGAQVLAVSGDSIYSHGAWAAVRGLSLPLLSDFQPRGEVARRYGVWRDGDGCSERALYVIDPEGRISYSHVAPYLHHVPDIYEVLAAVDAARQVGASAATA